MERPSHPAEKTVTFADQEDERSDHEDEEDTSSDDGEREMTRGGQYSDIQEVILEILLQEPVSAEARELASRVARSEIEAGPELHGHLSLRREVDGDEGDIQDVSSLYASLFVNNYYEWQKEMALTLFRTFTEPAAESIVQALDEDEIADALGHFATLLQVSSLQDEEDDAPEAIHLGAELLRQLERCMRVFEKFTTPPEDETSPPPPESH